MSTNITKRLRGIWHAWHFQFALSLVFKVLCRNLCIACLHPLTRRYMPKEEIWLTHYTLNVRK
ncbi:DUF3265 domain-containing protein [Vibrio parahaemolyticus]|nr:DUF3265 domain-containing protein [Vibrio parahaemolyticus]